MWFEEDSSSGLDLKGDHFLERQVFPNLNKCKSSNLPKNVARDDKVGKLSNHKLIQPRERSRSPLRVKRGQNKIPGEDMCLVKDLTLKMLKDVKILLMSRDPRSQLKAADIVMKSVKKAGSNKTIVIDTLLDGDILYFLCDALSSTLLPAVCVRLYHCLAIFTRYPKFFAQFHVNLVLDCVVRSLVVSLKQNHHSSSMSAGFELLQTILKGFPDQKFSRLDTSQIVSLLYKVLTNEELKDYYAVSLQVLFVLLRCSLPDTKHINKLAISVKEALAFVSNLVRAGGAATALKANVSLLAETVHLAAKYAFTAVKAKL